MTPTPAVSIAMATYNGARFLGEQLQSFAAQTVLPAELVVTDDKSTDDTIAILTAFAAKAPFPVRIEQNPERLGYRGNFMKAANLCRSEFVAFSDQDDVWLPHKLQTCVAPFAEEDVLLVYHNATVVTVDLQPYGSLGDHGAPRRINPSSSLGPWHFGLGFTLVFRRKLMDFFGEWEHSSDFHDPKEREGHDQWFFFLASSLGSIGYIEEPLVLYRQHHSNTFGWMKDHRPKLVRLWSNLMLPGMDDFRTRELAARQRAFILERIKDGLDANRGRRASVAASGYRKLEAIYRLRQKMYLAESLYSRSFCLMDLARTGGYQPGTKWGVGSKSLLRDLVRGVLFPAG